MQIILNSLIDNWLKLAGFFTGLVIFITRFKQLKRFGGQILCYFKGLFSRGERLTLALEDLGNILKATNTRMDGFAAQLTTISNRASQAHALSREMFENSPIPYFECDSMTGKCVWTNTAIQKIFGLPREEMMGEGWTSAIHPDDIHRVRTQWDETIKHWRPYRCRYRLSIKGVTTLVEAKAVILLSPEGTALSAWGTVEIIKEGQ